MHYDEAVSLLTEAERNTPLTDLLASVGLEHSPLDGHRRIVKRTGSGEALGNFSASEGIILYIEQRAALRDAA